MQDMIANIPVPIKLVSPNQREHWTKKYKRDKLQKEITLFALKVYELDIPRNFPLEVTLYRLARNRMDDDNLAYAFKHIRDTVAAFLLPGLRPGRADGDERIAWRYEQVDGRDAIKIKITPISKF